MAEVEYRCFIGGLAWVTDNQSLERAFSQYGKVIESKIVNDRDTRRSRGFGFVTFKVEQSMRDAIEAMNGQKLDGRSITVDQSNGSSGSGGRGSGYRGSHRDGGGCGSRKYGRREGGYGGDGQEIIGTAMVTGEIKEVEKGRRKGADGHGGEKAAENQKGMEKWTRDIQTGEIIGRGTERVGLYYVDEITQPSRAMLTTGSTDKEAWLWHKRSSTYRLVIEFKEVVE